METESTMELESEVYLSIELEKDIRDRLSRIEGHIRGVSKMLSKHKSCEDLLIQMAAIRAAVDQTTIKLLEGHMDTCVTECIEAGDGVEALDKLKGALATVLKRV